MLSNEECPCGCKTGSKERFAAAAGSLKHAGAVLARGMNGTVLMRGLKSHTMEVFMQSEEPVTQAGSPKRERSLWMSYIMLLIFSFSVYWPLLLILGIITLPFGYMARSGYHRQGREVEAAHASWQVNTILIAFLLIVVAFLALLGVSAWMEGDPQVQAQLDAINASGMPALEKLRAVWQLPSARIIMVIFIVFVVCCLVWPLKRTLHGALALWEEVSPAALDTGKKLLTFGLAVVIQAGVMLIPSLLL